MSQLKDILAIVGLSLATATTGCVAQDTDDSADAEIAAVDQDNSLVEDKASESTGESHQAWLGGFGGFGWGGFGWGGFGWGGFGGCGGCGIGFGGCGLGWGGFGWGGFGGCGCGLGWGW